MAGKQDTLVSGTNIKTINGNSVLGEGNINIEVPSSEELQKLNSLPNFVTLTKAEYYALGTKDENTYYFIKEA